jgi:hypothetical protein
MDCGHEALLDQRRDGGYTFYFVSQSEPSDAGRQAALKGGAVMALIVRILGVSLLTSVLVAGLGLALLQSVSRPAMPSSEYIIPVLFLACVGGIIGAVAGAAREIVSAQRPKASHWADAE